MLKWTMGAAITTVLIAIVITWQAYSCETQNQQDQAAATAHPLHNPMVLIPASPNGDVNQQQRQNQAGGTTPNANSYFCRVATPTNLPTIYLVLIGFGGIVVAIGTLEILGKQTEAAVLNAKAVINSERPWLVVTPENSNIGGKPGYFVFRATNKGRTPSVFVSGSFTHTFKRGPNELPIPPEYKSPFMFPNQSLLDQDEFFTIQTETVPSPLGIDVLGLIDRHAKENPHGAIYDMLFFYGKIVYDDTFGTENSRHETRWCFAFHKDGLRFVRTSPDGCNGYKYNRYT